jgi:Uri superfamily endonuclease
VASSLCRPKAVTCIVLKMSVIESNLASLFWTNRQNIRTLGQFSSTAKESTLVYRIRRESLWESLKGKLQ